MDEGGPLNFLNHTNCIKLINTSSSILNIFIVNYNYIKSNRDFPFSRFKVVFQSSFSIRIEATILYSIMDKVRNSRICVEAGA